MKPSIAYTDQLWTRIVDHYFDHVHWSEDNQLMPDKRCLTPTMWLRRHWGADVDVSAGRIYFEAAHQATWFSLHWS